MEEDPMHFGNPMGPPRPMPYGVPVPFIPSPAPQQLPSPPVSNQFASSFPPPNKIISPPYFRKISSTGQHVPTPTARVYATSGWSVPRPISSCWSRRPSRCLWTHVSSTRTWHATSPWEEDAPTYGLSSPSIPSTGIPRRTAHRDAPLSPTHAPQSPHPSHLGRHAALILSTCALPARRTPFAYLSSCLSIITSTGSLRSSACAKASLHADVRQLCPSQRIPSGPSLAGTTQKHQRRYAPAIGWLRLPSTAPPPHESTRKPKSSPPAPNTLWRLWAGWRGWLRTATACT